MISGKIYISGPMSGVPEFNFPLFRKVANSLRDKGYEVVCPTEVDGGSIDKLWEYYMVANLQRMMDCQSIMLLPGWEKSRGATTEALLAYMFRFRIFIYFNNQQGFKEVPREYVALNIHLDLLIPEADRTLSEEKSILIEAEGLVHGARQGSYGHPAEDFERQARIWSVILGTDVKPEQVGLCMVAVKMSRECHAHKRDNLVDIAGYAATIQMVHEKKLQKTERG